jgi:hypothetical protein
VRTVLASRDQDFPTRGVGSFGSRGCGVDRFGPFGGGGGESDRYIDFDGGRFARLLHLVINTSLGEVAILNLRGATTTFSLSWCSYETTRISANGIPNLSTSVVVPGDYHVQSLSQRVQNPYRKDKNSKVEYNIYFITLIRVHLFGTCRVQVHQD